MRVVIAPDSFKGVLDAKAAALCMAEGVRRAAPDAQVTLLPMADGGEGTLDILVDAAHGNRRRVKAHGPMGDEIEVTVGLINDAATAVIEMAKVSGFTLVPADRCDPLVASTFGLGEVIHSVVESGFEDVLLAIGGSATVDGGAGMMQALGMTLLDRDGRVMRDQVGGGRLRDVGGFYWDKAPANIANVQFTIAHDVLNPACGPGGAAAVFGPQKGADASGVKLLDEGLARWAEILEASCGRSLRNEPGMGAGGAVAMPLVALTSASMAPGVDLVSEAIGLAGSIGNADLVITGEGKLDRQSMMGKVVGAVGRMAKSAGVRCVAIVGTTGPGAEACMAVLDRYHALDGPITQTPQRLAAAAEKMAGEILRK